MRLILKNKLPVFLLAIFAVLLLAPRAHAVRIRSFCRLFGAESLRVEGVGIVTGLNGSGDSSDAVKVMLKKLMEANKYNLSLSDLSSKNIALVRVDAEIQPFARPGDRVNLRVTSINDAKSLKNGVLRICILKFVTSGEAIVRAGGRVDVGDNPTSGIIQTGGLVLKADMLNRTIIDKNGVFRLILERPNYADAGNIALKINNDQATNPAKGTVYGFADDGQITNKVAIARDAKEVLVKIPEKYKRRQVEYISLVLDRDVQIESVAEIRINKQTGIAVISGAVEVQPGFISYRGRMVTLQNPQGENQYPNYAIENDTPRSMVDVFGPNESGGSGRRSLQSLVETLQAMRCTTDDIIEIVKQMKSTGLIQANVIVE